MTGHGKKFILKKLIIFIVVLGHTRNVGFLLFEIPSNFYYFSDSHKKRIVLGFFFTDHKFVYVGIYFIVRIYYNYLLLTAPTRD